MGGAEITPLCNLLHALYSLLTENTEDLLLQGATQLITELNEMSGPLSSSRTNYVLQKMFRLVDSQNVTLLLRLCRVIEMVRPLDCA